MTKSNYHILELYIHIHTKNEVSMNIYMDRRAYKRKVPKWLDKVGISWNE